MCPTSWDGEREFVDLPLAEATARGLSPRISDVAPASTTSIAAAMSSVQHNLQLAKAFKDAVEATGARVIFALVPGREVR